jgi:flagella basal body P-ring formation protein FlgA
MKKNVCLIWMLWTAVAAVFGAAGNVRIYLPPEKTVDSQILQLGQVALLLGDESLVQTVGTVQIGTFSAPGQQLLIDRPTLLSCLAAAGITAGQVQFNGAEISRVRRDEKTIAADRFTETARLFLENYLAGQKPASLKLIRPAQEFVLPSGSAEVELSARMSDQQSRGIQRVTVTVLQQGKEVGRQDVMFAVQYESRRAVAVRRMEAGTEITPDDIKIESYTTDRLEKEDLFLPYGMLAKRTIEAGVPLERTWVEPKVSPVLVKRQQQVILKIDTELLQISAHGEAMEDGRAGDLIRVRRGSRTTGDERFVVGRIMSDGTIQPILN